MRIFDIRKANYDDVDKIYDNLRLCSENMYRTQGLQHWIPIYSKDSIIKDLKNKEVFVIEFQNIIVGNFILTNQKNILWNDDKNAIYLSKLAIIPQYAGKGLGKKCMEYIETYARKEGADFVRFDVYDKSMNTLAFYKKLDYITVGYANTRRFTVQLMEKRL